MKKWLAILLMLSMLLSFAACDSSSSDVDDDEEEVSDRDKDDKGDENDDKANRGLSPEKVFEAISDGKKVSFSYVSTTSMGDSAFVLDLMLARDGDVMMTNMIFDDGEEKQSQSAYADMKSKKVVRR